MSRSARTGGAPAIVIFGAAVRPDGQPSATLRRRVEAAARFGARFAEAVYVPTGGIGRFGPAEAAIMSELLRRLGVAEDRIVREETGTDTLSSVRAVAALLRTRRHRGPVYAATSAYHLPRCVLLLRLAGLDAHACPPPPVPTSRRFFRRWYWRLREVPALVWDASLLLLNPHPNPLPKGEGTCSPSPSGEGRGEGRAGLSGPRSGRPPSVPGT